MSILQTIRDTIVKNLNGGWLQLGSLSEFRSDKHRKIQDNEITPEIWFGVGSGDNVIPNSQFAQYKDNDGDNIEFVDDFYDFNGSFTAGATIEEKDVKWLLGEGTGKDNRVFSSSLAFDNMQSIDVRIFSYVWGRNSILGATSTIGIMDILKNKSYAKSVYPAGIENDREMIKTFLKELSKLDEERPNNSFSLYWPNEILNMKKSLLASTGDMADMIEGVPKGFYSLDTFAKKISIATSFILEYGEFTQELDDGGLENVFQLDAGDMTLKEYTTGGDTTTRSEEAIASGSNVGYVRYIREEVWEARLRDGYLYASSQGTSIFGEGIQFLMSDYNYWLGNSYKEDVKKIEDGLEGERKEIVEFLQGIGESFKETIYPVGDNPYWKTGGDGALSLSNKVAGEPRNIQGYQDQIPLFLDPDREEKWDFQNQIIDEYFDFAISVQLNTIERDEDGNINLTKVMDKKSFDLAYLTTETIVANRLNELRGKLFENLEVLLDDDPTNDNIDGIISESAARMNDAANLGYEEDEISEKELAERQKLLEQCALLLNLKQIDEDYNKSVEQQQNAGESIHASGYFNSRFLRMQGNMGSRTITSLYAQRESVQAFLEMNPVIQGLLVPKVKIQKVIIKNGVTYTVDVPFTAITTELDSITPINYQNKYVTDDIESLKTPVFRGGGVGIKSISFDFDGETPATAQKWVRSTMSLKFQDFTDIVNTRDTSMVSSDNDEPQRTDFRFIDLIVNSTENANSDDGYDSFFREYYKPSDYKIKIEVGWDYQKTDATEELIQKQLDSYFVSKDSEHRLTTADLDDALVKQNKTFLFAALDHDLNINDDGSVDLNINYFGYPDALLNSYNFNALVTRSKEKEIKDELDDLFDKIRNGQCNATQLSKLQAIIEQKRQSIVKKASASIIKRIQKNGSQRHVRINDEQQLKAYKTTGGFTKVPKIQTDLNQPIEKTAGNTKAFFLLGDLLYVLLDCLYEGNSTTIIEEAKNISFILTDFEFEQYLQKSGDTTETEEGQPIEKIQINLASIPICVDFFKEWFTEEIISSERYNYPVMEFILVLLNRLMGDILTEVCFNKKADKTLFFRQAQMYGNGDGFEAFNYYSSNNEDGESRFGILNIDAPALKDFYLPISFDPSYSMGAHDMFTYVAIYPDFKPNVHGGRGKYHEDMEQGIYHFHIGSNIGLLKKINFSKTNITYLRESRMLRYRGIGDFAQLSNVYNVSMELFGNFLFFPGMQIFIDPFGIGGDDFGRPQDNLFNATTNTINYSKLMGIGGYHLITSVKTTIGVEGFKTNVEARYFFSGDGDGNDDTIDGLIRKQQGQADVGVDDDGTDTQSCNKIISTFETNAITGDQ